MQFHNGMRLKKIIKNQTLTITEISKRSEVASSSIYDLFKKPEVTPGRIRPILEVIGISVEDFFYSSKIENRTGKEGLVIEIENLKRQNELLREQITQQKEMILLLKKGNKK